ncbi:MAG: response regulator [Leptospiraceae bacterium]|nr:response regulator [Leptospiraceae bacterium]
MQSRTILLVEDEPSTALLVSRILQNAHFRVMLAATGEEAIQKALGETMIHLILSDIDLGPGMDGPEAMRQILQHKEIPVIFHTSHSEKMYVDRVRQITRYGYVIKNSGTFVLLNSIATAFELFEANQKLKQSEARLQQIADKSSAWLWETDEKGRFLYSNTVAEKLIGQSAHALIRKSKLFDFLIPQKKSAMKAAMLSSFQKNEDDAWIQCDMHDSNRNTVHLDCHGYPVYNDSGQITGYRGFIFNISDRLRIEKERLLFAEFQHQVVRAQDLSDIFRITINTLDSLLEDTIKIVSYLDRSSQTLQIQEYSGLNRPVSKLTEILSFDPRTNKVHIKDMTDEELQMYRSGKMELLENGLYVLFTRKVPKVICRQIGKFLNIKNVYAVGFVDKTEHIGGLILLSNQDLACYAEIIERITNFTAMAVLRIEAESAQKIRML